MPTVLEVLNYGRKSLAWTALITAFFVATPFGFAATEMQVELEQTQYMSDAAYDEQSNQYSNFIPTLQGQHFFMHGRLTTKGDATAILPLNEEGEFHFYSRDLYARYEAESFKAGTLAFTFGRSLRLWSQLDSDWGLGLWQPLFRGDYVNPIAMGFTGFFTEAIGDGLKVTIFASPIHLPDEQNDFSIDNGEVKSGNRWFRAPVSHLEIENGSSHIYYELDKPRAEDVVFNGVYALSVTGGDETNGAWARMSFADKPMNQFHLAVQTEGIVFVDMGSGQIQTRPIIHPKVVRHQLTTFETGYSWDDRNKVYVSATTERIRDPELPEGWEQTELRDSTYYGAGGSVGLGAIGLKQSLLSVAFVERVFDESSGSTNVQGRIEASTQRLLFNQLASIALSQPIYRQKNQRLSSQIKYTHSFSDNGDWVSAQVAYSPEKRLNYHLGIDVLGAPDEVAGDRSFISSYRNNDRVFGGISYVF